MVGQVSAILNVCTTANGEITITVSSPFRDDRLAIDETSIALTLWSEGPEVIRGRFQHGDSQEFAYFQSSGPSLRRLAEAIHLVGPSSA